MLSAADEIVDRDRGPTEGQGGKEEGERVGDKAELDGVRVGSQFVSVSSFHEMSFDGRESLSREKRRGRKRPHPSDPEL